MCFSATHVLLRVSAIHISILLTIFVEVRVLILIECFLRLCLFNNGVMRIRTKKRLLHSKLEGIWSTIIGDHVSGVRTKSYLKSYASDISFQKFSLSGRHFILTIKV